MSGSVRCLRRRFLRLTGSIVASVLSTLGMTGCSNPQAEPTYGVPGFAVNVGGTARSAADSSAVRGIRVGLDRILSGDTVSVDSVTSNIDGFYYLSHWETWDEVPDGYTILVTAEDADTSEYGCFGRLDTLIPVTPSMLDDQQIQLELDLYLPEN